MFALVELNNDAYVPFAPFALFFALWIVTWGIAYFRNGAETPSPWASRLLGLWPAALLIGWVVVLGNGDTSIGPLVQNILRRDDALVEGSGELGRALLIGLLAALIPLVNPKRMLQSGIRPQRTRRIARKIARGLVRV